LKSEYKIKFKDAKSKLEVSNLKILFKKLKKNLSKLLIVTEVKSRADDRFGVGCECINVDKKKHLERGAKTLLKMPKFKDLQVRFDVASVDYGKVFYIENAF
jgi:Holliday junction resolvase-like predicted endonuclease